MSKAEGVEKKRIHFMDEVRGLDILLMVIFHAAYVAGWIFHWEWGRQFFLFFKPVEPFFSGIFIFICGISCRLSRSNLKRGLMIGACALLMLALLLVLLSLYRDSPENYRLLLVRWGLIVGGSGLLFLLAGMVSSALEVFFTITAALLTRRIWLTVGERQEKF